MEEVEERTFLVGPGTQDDLVEEVADDPLPLGPAPVGGGHADQRLGLPGTPREQELERREDRRHERGAVLADDLAQPGDGAAGQGPGVGRPGEVLPRRSRPVGRHLEDGQLAGEFLLPVAPGGLTARPVQVRQLPPQEVGQRGGVVGREVRGSAPDFGGVEGMQLLDEEVHRPQVGHEVVEDEQEDDLIGPLVELEPETRAARQVERSVAPLLQVFAQLVPSPVGCVESRDLQR